MTTLNNAQQAAQDLQTPRTQEQCVKYLSLPDAARLIPTTSGKKVSVPTLHRWCMKGCNGVKLRHQRFGKRIVTTPEALDEFSRLVAEVYSTEADQATSTTPTRTRHTSSPTPRTEEQRKQAAAAAMNELRNAGIA